MEYLYHFFNSGLLVYAVCMLSCYIFLGTLAIAEAITYLRKSKLTDYNLLASSPFAPSVSILAPAYNEGANIVENVRSLLNIYYNHLELIIINDGSKDDSMAKLIAAYQLEPVNISYHPRIPTKKVKAIYKSTNSVFGKLVVIDKENGGKADALNTGINIAKHQYLVCIDVDCILEQDALLKLLKPFMESTEKKVIATGGVVRIANSCLFENGKLVEVNLPKQFLPRAQALEYIRAFLLGRMAWSRLNGLLLISGAFGAFDRKIAIEAGGYDHRTVGEDMELVVRMRRYMADRKLPYKVTFIPDPLCWTEAPATYQILGRQRNRWMRGTIETLRMHRGLFFNPKYGLLGMLSYPYWFFFEFLAPVVEFTGFVLFVVLALAGLINWPFFLALTGFIFIFGWLFSIFAILMEVATFNQYKKKGEVGKLILTAILEPFLFHPFVVWSSIRGIVDLVRKKNSWGEMTRQGFSAPPVAKPDTGA
ncbi:glycosyltransferase family 2 protein [Sabulibacter ruber]|uniref:glycosyltransferase family 2 protein n=1 Tax=Sabulibacter ruber TaxID=2811901 RepID=UPI001A97C3A0|nr:glycosyltransferase [Sabulibacter ruber]